MNIINYQMLSLLLKAITKNTKIDRHLLEILETGFIEVSGCYFLKRLFEHQKHINIDNFSDRTGYECFINSIHVDDYVDDNFLVQGLLFCDLLITHWNKQNSNNIAEVIFGQTDFGYNIKLCLKRDNECWISNDDFNKFEEGLLIIRTQ